MHIFIIVFPQRLVDDIEYPEPLFFLSFLKHHMIAGVDS